MGLVFIDVQHANVFLAFLLSKKLRNSELINSDKYIDYILWQERGSVIVEMSGRAAEDESEGIRDGRGRSVHRGATCC